MDAKGCKLDPIPAILIESMRDIGYNFDTALADIVDNSISAGAKNISIEARIKPHPIVAVFDDGLGLSPEELIDSMRLGSMDPHSKRNFDDLGRFGLGLKTASFSQCRKLTVVSRKQGSLSCCCWDLDYVVEHNEWELLFFDDLSSVPFAERLDGCDGTLVIWENLDRLNLDPDNPSKSEKVFNRTIVEAEEHLALVFHRFLIAEPGFKKIAISLNGRAIEGIDPFNKKHLATIAEPEELLADGTRIQAFTLPHHSKYSNKSEYEKFGLQGGYVKNQGIYLYRARRLIIHGTWFNLTKKTQLTQLCRVQIDIDNQHDEDWKIDVKKVSAQLPENVRATVKNFLDTFKRPSVGVYKRRGAKITSSAPLPIWELRRDNGKVWLEVSKGHPVLDGFRDYLKDDYERARFDLVLRLIESSIPVDALMYEFSNEPESVSLPSVEQDTISKLAKTYFVSLQAQQIDLDDILAAMRHTPIFKDNWDVVCKALNFTEED